MRTAAAFEDGTAQHRKALAAEELRDSIRSLMNGFRGWVEDEMRPEGMTAPQLRLLFAVFKEPDASSAAIARHCQVTPQTLQAMLQRAEREGWLVRRPAAHNARILTPALTRKGKALLDRAKRRFAAFELETWRDATTAELQSMNALLSKALGRLRADEARRPKGTAAGRARKKSQT